MRVSFFADEFYELDIMNPISFNNLVLVCKNL